MSEIIEKAITKLTNKLSRKYGGIHLLRSTTSEWTTYYRNPIILDPEMDYEVALVYFSTFNTVFNISSINNNNKFIYSKDNGVTWKTMIIDDGGYEIDALNTEIKRQLVLNDDTSLNNGQTVYPIELSLNLSTTKTVITIATNYKVNFTTGTVGYILGFNNGILSTGINNSNTIARLTNITAILLQLDIVSEFYVDGEARNILYSFPGNLVGIGYSLPVFPNTPIYLPLNKTSISQIYTRITDDNDNVISFNGENIVLCFHIRQV